MSSANLSRAETTARARALDVHSYHVELDLRGAVDQDRTGFPTVTTIEFTASTPETWLDFLGDSVESVTVNGDLTPVIYDGARIAIRGLREINVVDDPSPPVATADRARACTASSTRSTATSTCTRSTSRPTPAAFRRASSSPT